MLQSRLMMEPKLESLLHFTFWINQVDKSGVDLYREDGLAAVNNATEPKLEIIWKDINKVFKEDGLLITIKTNLIKTDFLGVSDSDSELLFLSKG